MNEQEVASLAASFGNLPDPRVQKRCDHQLIDIIIIAICGVICGADSWTEIKESGREKESWLREFLELEQGFPRMTPLDGYLA